MRFRFSRNFVAWLTYSKVFRVLRYDGVFLYITFRQPHFMRPILNRDDIWDLQMEFLSDDKSSFDYHGFILKKKQDVNGNIVEDAQ
jgi:hypothetical protein